MFLFHQENEEGFYRDYPLNDNFFYIKSELF